MWRLVLSALAVLAYGLLAHVLTVHAADSPWSLAIVWGPLLLSVAAYAVARRRWGLLGLAAAALLGARLAGGMADLNRLYVLQHAGVHAVLAAAFAATLRRGEVPMITRVALRVHGGQMPAAKHAYTRRVTQAWLAYFAGMAALSLALYAWAPWPWWSVYANLVTPLAAASMMLGEWRLRYVLHPEFERVPIATAMRAFRQAPSPTAP